MVGLPFCWLCRSLTWLPILLNLRTLLYEMKSRMNLKCWHAHRAHLKWKEVLRTNMGRYPSLFRFSLLSLLALYYNLNDLFWWPIFGLWNLQLYISRGSIDTFSLVSDAAYISASLARIMRALFEICLRRGWSEMSLFLLEYCKAVDRQIWPHQHPLRQFDKDLSLEVCTTVARLSNELILHRVW